MYALRVEQKEPDDEDQHVVLRGTFADFETMLAIRGDDAGVRMYYLDGEIELMSPARVHENRKTTLARLLETWATEHDIDLNGFGSWTLKQSRKDAGAEPDECYILGSPDDREGPDLVIEVEWSRSLGLAKHEIYRRLGVRELWTLRRDKSLLIRSLRDEQWVETEQSTLLPSLDLRSLLAFADIEPQSKAVRALLDALRVAPR